MIELYAQLDRNGRIKVLLRVASTIQQTVYAKLSVAYSSTSCTLACTERRTQL